MGYFTKISAAALIAVFGTVNAFSQEAGDAEAQLSALIAAERSFHYQENPGTGPRGKPRPVATSMRRVSLADQERRAEMVQGFIDQLDAIDSTALNADGQINLEMLRYKLDRDRLFLKYRSWRLPLYSDSGFHTSPARMWRGINFRSANDYEAFLQRL